MNPATLNTLGNGNDVDLDMSFYTLEEAIDMAEFQESLNYDDLDFDIRLVLVDMEEV